jgi:hypothetical protein
MSAQCSTQGEVRNAHELAEGKHEGNTSLAQLVKKFPAFFGPLRVTRSRLWALS